MNGIVLENNNGSSYGDSKRYFGTRIPFLVKLPEMLFDFTSLNRLDDAIRSHRPHHPLVYNLASPRRAFVYEQTTYAVKKRGADTGLLVGVNHFVDPSWPILPTRNPDGIQYSELRHNN